MPRLTDADPEGRVPDFFSRLYANAEGGWLEVRCIHADADNARGTGRLCVSDWFPIAEGQPAFLHAYEYAIYHNQCGWDCFFGVNPRTRYGMNDADVLNGVATWVDIDGIHGPEYAEQALGMAEHPVPLDAAVFSGAGLHLYWVLSEPRDPASDDFILYRNSLKSAARFYGGDRQSVNVGRVLRFPLSYSHKRGCFTRLWLRGEP